MTPQPILEKLLAFCGVDGGAPAVHAAIGQIDASRAYAFRQLDEGRTLHRRASQRPLMQEVGYDKIE